LRDDVEVGPNDLLEMPSGIMTEAGLRRNIRVSIHYLAAWLSGNGCIPISHLMEDAATAEISRSQVWQWLSYAVCTDDGASVTPDRVRRILGEETERLMGNGVGGALGTDCIEQSAQIFEEMVTAPVLDDWLTVIAQQFIDWEIEYTVNTHG